MSILPYIVTYLSLAIFVAAVIARILKWSRMPMHLRWELYPVAHEGGGRAAYGGSYLEESKWWTKPRKVSLLGELKVMVPEITLLVALREYNRKLWTRSFPFHFGLYLVGASTAWMILAGILAALVPSLAPGLALVTRTAIPVVGGIGLVLGLIGAVGLFLRRRSRELRDYTAPADLFNLVFFVVAFGCALLTFALVDRDFSIVSGFVANLVTFRMAALPGEGLTLALPVLSVILLAALAAYIPLTHMSHFIGKYFAYHAIRWQDDPNLPGGKEERVINELLDQPITWAAPHIQGDGKKTWLDAATEEQKS